MNKINSKNKLLIMVLFAIVWVLFFATLSHIYNPYFVIYEPIQGTVIDEKTNEPLSDVIVVAIWKLQGGLEGLNTVGIIHIDEVLTNKNGEYVIPGWKGFKPYLSFFFRPSIHFDSPELYFYKNGYHYSVLVNRDSKDKNSFKRGFKWNGIELKLKELGEEEDKDKMLNQLYFSNFTSLMDFINQDCLWKKFPKFVKENEIVDKNLLTLYSRINSKPGLDNSKKEYQKICGSFESFYKETIK